MLLGAAAIAGGLSAAGQIGSTFLNSYLSRKNEKKSLARQYAYAQQYALNSPSWNVEGLRKANLNPILAATDGAFSSPTVPNVSSGSNYGSINPQFDLVNALNLEKQTNSNVQVQTSQANLNMVRAINEMKNMGFSGSAAVAARFFSELTGMTLDKDGLRSFENFWNSIQPNNVPLGKNNPIDTPTPSHDIKTRHHPSDQTLSDHPVVKEFIKNDERISHKIEDSISGFIPDWFRRWQDHNERSLEARRKEYRFKHPPKRNRNSNYWYHQ